MRTIQVNEDHSENVPYRWPDFPVFAMPERLSYYFGLNMAGHWHEAIEFILVDEGTMEYLVEGRPQILRSGEGLLVNSRRLHGARAIGGQDCAFDCILFSPALIAEHPRLRAAAVESLTGPDMPDAVPLDPAEPWQRELMEALRDAFTRIGAPREGFELGVLGSLYRIWQILYDHLEPDAGLQRPMRGKSDILHRMVGFIQDHFSERVTLAEIAESGGVSPGYCCALFQEFLRKTPMSYLAAYRLEKSLGLLVDTARPITEIAGLCGFSSASYFAEQFRRQMGETPREYRRRRRKNSGSGGENVL